MKIEMPKDVASIISRLQHAGHEAYIVGGCVRDTLMGREPEDWDITTSAKPEEVKVIFIKTIDTGIRHGTVTVLVNGNGYEVTTYRIDGDYADGRHPDNVKFTRSLREDLKRRDFTINAIAYNDENGIRDDFDGIPDLQRHIIRAVGDPFERFSEDALRMMRAIRFSAQLGFNIDIDTYQAIKVMSEGIKNVSMERVQAELAKTILSDHPECVSEYRLTGLFAEILPSINAVLGSKDADKIRSMLRYMPSTPVMRYAALLGTLRSEEAREAMKTLKIDNNTTDTVTKIIKYSGEEETLGENEFAVREAMYRHGPRLMEYLFVYSEAEILTKEEVTGLNMRGSRNHLKTIRRYYDEIMERGDCISLRDLDVTGDDLLERGYSGKKIGETLDWLMHIVLENPKLNDKETLLDMLDAGI